MKTLASKILSVFLILSFVIGIAPVVAEIEIDTGIWEKRAYVDEFDLPTDEYYISNREPIIGKFSNSATTDSLLNVWVYVDEGSSSTVSVKLIEYGSNIVKNSYSQDKLYEVIMMDPSGNKYSFVAYMPSGQDLLRFDYEESVFGGNQTVLDALCSDGTVRFAISEWDNKTTKYVFSIEDTEGLFDMLPYTAIGEFSDGLAYVRKAGRYGFIDTTGSVVIPCEYDRVWSFDEELAKVTKDGKQGYIDTAGTIVVPFEYALVGFFQEGLADVTKAGKKGFIDAAGNMVIPCEYDSVDSFHKGFAEVEKDGKYGLIDTVGNIVIPCEYEKFWSHSERLAIVQKDYGNWLIDFVDDTIIPWAYGVPSLNYHEGLSEVQQDIREGFEKDYKYGYIDTFGKIDISCEYDAAEHFSEGLALVKKDEKFGYIDIDGNIVIPFEYDKASSFSNGLAQVNINGKWGTINAAGNIIIPCEYEWIDLFSEGLALVKKNGKYGYIDTDGNIVIPCEYDYVDIGKTGGKSDSFSEGLAFVNKDGKYGYIDFSGNTLISCEYAPTFVDYGEGYFSCLKDGKVTIIPRNDVQTNWEAELNSRNQQLIASEEARRNEAKEQVAQRIAEQKAAEEAARRAEEEARRLEAEKQKMLTEYTDKEIIKQAQTALNEVGYDCGKPDGIAGKGTAGAVTKYQTDMGLNITGTITHELLIALGVIAE